MSRYRWEAEGTTHGFDLDTDYCLCGGEWVWFEEEHTHGCFEAEPPPTFLDHVGREPEQRSEPSN